MCLPLSKPVILHLSHALLHPHHAPSHLAVCTKSTHAPSVPHTLRTCTPQHACITMFCPIAHPSCGAYPCHLAHALVRPWPIPRCVPLPEPCPCPALCPSYLIHTLHPHQSHTLTHLPRS